VLADRLPTVERLPAHEHEPEQHRQCGAEPEVDHGLRDRQVERAEVDRDPLVLLELRRRVELAARERAGRERRARQREDRARLIGVLPRGPV
jgi:hypothetical protein